VKFNDKIKKDHYRSVLDHQKQMANAQKQSYGAMTAEERQFNKKEINYFSNRQNSVEAMIPGINNLNTVGTSPLKRGAVNMIQSARGEAHSRNGFSQSMKSLPMMNHSVLKTLPAQPDDQPKNYNPITNPLPWHNDNPYVRKEQNRAHKTVLY
jgi:hypothetical protein